MDELRPPGIARQSDGLASELGLADKLQLVHAGEGCTGPRAGQKEDGAQPAMRLGLDSGGQPTRRR